MVNLRYYAQLPAVARCYGQGKIVEKIARRLIAKHGSAKPARLTLQPGLLRAE